MLLARRRRPQREQVNDEPAHATSKQATPAPASERAAALWEIATASFALLAYRPLFLLPLELPTLHQTENWFFGTPESPLLPMALALWLVWRRSAAFRALPAAAAARTAALLSSTGMLLFFWAHLAQAADLLAPSLALNLLGVVALLRGFAGCRLMLLPALVLSCAVSIPGPLRNELVWWLQNATTSAAGQLLLWTGHSGVAWSGILMQAEGHSFVVIESCSGLRSIELLVLVALIVRELFEASRRRQWIVVLASPALAFALNIARVALIATSEDPQGIASHADSHIVQGLAVVIAGTLSLYLVSYLLDSGQQAEREPMPPRTAPPHPSRWRLSAGVFAGLAAASFAIPALPRAEARAPALGEFPMQHAGWRASKELKANRVYLGELPVGQILYRRYRKRLVPDERRAVVGVFVAVESPDARRRSPFSEKLEPPGPGWWVRSHRPERIWALGVDARLSWAESEMGTAEGEAESVITYTWRLRDEGLARETLRSLLALETKPFERRGKRIFVRLATPILEEGGLGRERAKQRLDRFTADFTEVLERL